MCTPGASSSITMLTSITFTLGHRLSNVREGFEYSQLRGFRARRKKAVVSIVDLNKAMDESHFINRMLCEMIPKRQRRTPRYSNPVPSTFCHLCSKRKQGSRTLVCGNVEKGSCRKMICEYCFNSYELGDFDALFTRSDNNWVCTHCTATCPEGSQCFKYEETNDRLRLCRLKSKPSQSAVRHTAEKIASGKAILDFMESTMPEKEFENVLVEALADFDMLLAQSAEGDDVTMDGEEVTSGETEMEMPPGVMGDVTDVKMKEAARGLGKPDDSILK